MELGHEISHTSVSTQKILACKKSANNIKIWRIYKQFTALALKKPFSNMQEVSRYMLPKYTLEMELGHVISYTPVST